MVSTGSADSATVPVASESGDFEQTVDSSVEDNSVSLRH